MPIFFFQISNETFISNFKNENFQFFHFKIPWHISIFCLIFLFFPFPSGGMTIFFKIQKQKFLIQIYKMIFFISNFLCGIKGFFSRTEVAKFIKSFEKIIYLLLQNRHILHMVQCKRARTCSFVISFVFFTL
jgi:hypothetical protein